MVIIKWLTLSGYVMAVIYHHMDILGDILLVRLCDGSHIPPYGYTKWHSIGEVMWLQSYTTIWIY